MLTIRAAWVFPVAGPPIPGGCVTIDGETIARVGPADPSVTVDLDLGDAAIVPGFVNAHTHLELGPIPWDEAAGPEDQVGWLKRVIRSRFDRSDDEVDALIRRNLRSAIEAGTTALGDITTAGRSWAALDSSPIQGAMFCEILGLSDARGRQTVAAFERWAESLDRPELNRSRIQPGLSPHAPYSTAGRLYRYAAESGMPLATHLGEMPAEREFLAQRSGPLREFVAGLGAWDDGWESLGPSPVDYLDGDPLLAEADWIVAHGNIFGPAEFDRLAAPRDPDGRRVAVAYCPRTHARFGHPPHPFRAMLDAGVVVCLGTDSLASTLTLSILDEVRFLRRHHPDVPGATLLRMATLHGAWSLRLDDRTGSLEAGKSADLAILGLGDTASADPHDRWLDHDAPPWATMFRGRFVAGPWA